MSDDKDKKDDGAKGRLIPNWDEFCARAAKQAYLRIQDLRVGDTLTAVSKNHRPSRTASGIANGQES